MVRLRNLQANPRAAVVVDDWAELDGWHSSGAGRPEITDRLPTRQRSVLRTRYPQYAMPLDDVIEHPVIGIAPTRIVLARAAARIRASLPALGMHAAASGTNDTPHPPDTPRVAASPFAEHCAMPDPLRQRVENVGVRPEWAPADDRCPQFVRLAARLAPDSLTDTPERSATR
jgi:hypothetical protein